MGVKKIILFWMETKKLDVSDEKWRRKHLDVKGMRQASIGSLHCNYSTRNCEKVDLLGHNAL